MLDTRGRDITRNDPIVPLEFIGSIYMIITPRINIPNISPANFSIALKRDVYVCTYDDSVIGKSRGFIENALM